MVPDELISNILKSIEIGLYQYGAEVQQVCFEFLQAFGTFIHLEQNSTSFAYQSTMQFIGIICEMVCFSNLNARIIWTVHHWTFFRFQILNQDLCSDNKNECSKALFSLMCTYKDRYGPIFRQIIQTRASSDHAERLSKEFEELTRAIDLVVNRTNQNMFVERFEKFIVNISFIYN